MDASRLDFASFDDLEQSVAADVEAIRRAPLIPEDIPVTGFVLDERTLRLQSVVGDPRSQLQGGLR